MTVVYDANWKYQTSELGDATMSISTLHPVSEIQGIGPAIQEKLEERHVYYTEQLLSLPVDQVCAWLAPVPGITDHKLRNSYIPQARLLRVEGIDGQFAEGLVASGISTYRRIVTTDPKAILTMLEDRVQDGTIPAVPELEDVISWQLNAAKLVATGMLLLTVIDKSSKKRLAGIKARIVGLDPLVRAPVTFESDERGIVVFDGLVPGKHTVVLTAEGYLRHPITFMVKPDSGRSVRIELRPGKHKPRIVDEFDGGVISPIALHETIKSRRVDLNDLPARPPVHVVEIQADDVLLSSLWRRKIDDVIEVLTFTLPKAELPQGIDKGSVLLPQNDDKYTMSEKSILEFRNEFIAERLAQRRLKRLEGG